MTPQVFLELSNMTSRALNSTHCYYECDYITAPFEAEGRMSNEVLPFLLLLFLSAPRVTRTGTSWDVFGGPKVHLRCTAIKGYGVPHSLTWEGGGTLALRHASCCYPSASEAATGIWGPRNWTPPLGSQARDSGKHELCHP